MALVLNWRHTALLGLLVAASSLVALLFSHSGRTRLALWLVLLCITYTVMHLAARSSGIENVGLATVPLLIVVTGLLVDRLTTLYFTATAVLATFGMLMIRYFVLRAE